MKAMFNTVKWLSNVSLFIAIAVAFFFEEKDFHLHKINKNQGLSIQRP